MFGNLKVKFEQILEERRISWHGALTGKSKIHFYKVLIFVIFLDSGVE
jgi:hypothetical protein